MKVFEVPHVIIFANFYPNLKALSMDRWLIVDLDNENDEPLAARLYPEGEEATQPEEEPEPEGQIIQLSSDEELANHDFIEKELDQQTQELIEELLRGSYLQETQEDRQDPWMGQDTFPETLGSLANALGTFDEGLFRE